MTNIPPSESKKSLNNKPPTPVDNKNFHYVANSKSKLEGNNTYTSSENYNIINNYKRDEKVNWYEDYNKPQDNRMSKNDSQSRDTIKEMDNELSRQQNLEKDLMSKLCKIPANPK